MIVLMDSTNYMYDGLMDSGNLIPAGVFTKEL